MGRGVQRLQTAESAVNRRGFLVVQEAEAPCLMQGTQAWPWSGAENPLIQCSGKKKVQSR